MLKANPLLIYKVGWLPQVLLRTVMMKSKIAETHSLVISSRSFSVTRKTPEIRYVDTSDVATSKRISQSHRTVIQQIANEQSVSPVIYHLYSFYAALCYTLPMIWLTAWGIVIGLNYERPNRPKQCRLWEHREYVMGVHWRRCRANYAVPTLEETESRSRPT